MSQYNIHIVCSQCGKFVDVPHYAIMSSLEGWVFNVDGEERWTCPTCLTKEEESHAP